jgi:hypothetical protein
MVAGIVALVVLARAQDGATPQAPADDSAKRYGATLQVTPLSDESGAKRFAAVSDFLGPDPTVIRVVEPTAPTPSFPRRLLYVLPVEPGMTTEASTFSDGLAELQRLNVSNRYGLTLIAPSFNMVPWYGDHDSDPHRRIESFVINDLVPFGDTFLPTGTPPRRWLIGFSKSGFGALTLILRHPDVFARAAAWDAPAQLHDMSIGMEIPDNFGSEENFSQYRIPELLRAHRDAFATVNRLWISGDDSSWTADMLRLHAQMTELGILHTFSRVNVRLVHSWYGGWLDRAVRSLVEQAAAGPVPDTLQRKRTPGR